MVGRRPDPAKLESDLRVARKALLTAQEKRFQPDPTIETVRNIILGGLKFNCSRKNKGSEKRKQNKEKGDKEVAESVFPSSFSRKNISENLGSPNSSIGFPPKNNLNSKQWIEDYTFNFESS